MAEDPHKLKRLVRELEKIRGTGTQLISLYIPPNYPRSELSSMLTDEYSKAGNIKSKQTRKNVQAALQKIMVYLKSIDYKIPETGLIIFCGNVSPDPGRSDIRLWAVVPPQPSPKIYRCDSTFYLEPLREMVKPSDVYGIVVMDGREATVALVKGNSFEIVGRVRSLAPGKHHKGGQSARRFERLIEQAEHEYHKKLAEVIKAAFWDIRNDLKGIIFGGPGPHKNEFLNADYLPNELKKKIIGVVDTGYTDEYGIREAMEAAKDLLKDAEIMVQKREVERFIGEAVKGGLVSYGVKNVYEDLKMGKVEELLISEDFSAWKGTYVCDNCGHRLEVVDINREKLEKLSPSCPSCGSPM
ncbi:MAG: peptide chain release factor 1, partial [Candidatus Diapherotrites archaeon]|nr:peptide chain release factor 1 [Candidatus Diapherotrites archaeon]